MSPDMIFRIRPILACLIEKELRLVTFSNNKQSRIILALMENVYAK
jgi:hypothetical protein